MSVELIGPDSEISDEMLRTLLQQHREGIEEFTADMETPRFPVTDPARLAMARSFGAHLLALLDEPATPADRETLRRRVNLAYEGLLVLIDYLKWTTDAPKVPRARRRDA